MYFSPWYSLSWLVPFLFFFLSFFSRQTKTIESTCWLIENYLSWRLHYTNGRLKHAAWKLFLYNNSGEGRGISFRYEEKKSPKNRKEFLPGLHTPARLNLESENTTATIAVPPYGGGGSSNFSYLPRPNCGACIYLYLG